MARKDYIEYTYLEWLYAVLNATESTQYLSRHKELFEKNPKNLGSGVDEPGERKKLGVIYGRRQLLLFSCQGRSQEKYLEGKRSEHD